MAVSTSTRLSSRRCSLPQHLLEAGEVEDVAQALAVGLEDHREVPVALGHLEQGLGLQPLLPQRRALARVGARDEQGAGGVLAEAGAEQGAAGQLAHDEVLELVGVDEHELGPGRLVGVGQVDDDPVVGPDGVGLEAELVADAGAEGQAPGGVHAAAERAEHAHPPVADLVAEALDDHRAVAGHHARGRLLLAQELEQVLGRELVEVVVALEHLGGLVDGPAREGADGLAELARTPHAVAAPERDGARHARRGCDDHAVAADLLDAPGRGAEQERLTRPRLVDHLLVELAHAAAVGQGDQEQPAVGNRAGVGDGQRAGALAGPDRALQAVPHDSRAQLGELARRVAAVEHVEHVLEQGAGQVGERVRAGDQRVEIVDRQVLHRRPWPLSAGRARRAGCAERRWTRSRPRACAARPPWPRAGRRGTWGRCGPSTSRPRRGRRGRCAAGRGRRTWATRPAGRGRRRPCRCRARASWSRPGRAGGRT